MKLFTYDPAPNPRRVNLFLSYKGIELPTEQVDLRARKQFSPHFQAINPRCVVPALQLDDGSVLCDGIAICTYLEHLYPQKPLLGTDALERAQILSWDQYIFSDGFLAVAEVLRNQSPQFEHRALPGAELFEQIPDLIARGRKRLHVFYWALERHLQGRQFIVAEQLTFADIDAFVTVDFGGWIKEKIPDNCPNLSLWYERVKPLLTGGEQ